MAHFLTIVNSGNLLKVEYLPQYSRSKRQVQISVLFLSKMVSSGLTSLGRMRLRRVDSWVVVRSAGSRGSSYFVKKRASQFPERCQEWAGGTTIRQGSISRPSVVYSQPVRCPGSGGGWSGRIGKQLGGAQLWFLFHKFYLQWVTSMFVTISLVHKSKVSQSHDNFGKQI